MKKTIFAIAICLFSITTYSQSLSPDDLKAIQAVFGKDKKELVKEYMVLPTEKSDKFWAVYDEYENKRTVLAKDRIAILQDYSKSYSTLTDKTATELGNRTLKNDMELDKLHTTYFKKMVTAVGGVTAAKFFQLDIYLQNTIRSSIQDEIPFIGELNKTKKEVNIQSSL